MLYNWNYLLTLQSSEFHHLYHVLINKQDHLITHLNIRKEKPDLHHIDMP